MPTAFDTLTDYLASVRKDVANGTSTEHTYRPAIKTLIEGLGSGINAINEPKRSECGAPDFAVVRKTQHGPLTLGHLEAKDVGKDLAAIEKDSNRANPTTDNGRQLKRYRDALPNLVLTDYLEFRWYVNGTRRGDPASLAVLDSSGKLKPDNAGQSAVVRLLEDFLAQTARQVSKPKELAERMARLTHLIRDVVVVAFDKDVPSPALRGLRDAFAEVLIPDLSVTDFADMFAQTMSYGLFAARVEHDPSDGSFRRQDAAHEIPRTNPFLRRLFAAITGPELDDEPFAGLVDDLAQLLASTDMAAVLADFGKREARTDPVMHFYETFLTAYDPAIRERRGVYYTPEPVVSYIVRSVDHILRTQFDLSGGLADQTTATYTTQAEQGDSVMRSGPRVLILDPSCGTGTFLYTVLDLIRLEFMKQNNAGKWSGFVREQLLPRLFGFELLMAPYSMAHLKLGMQLAAKDLPEEQRHDWAYDFATGERLWVYLTNTLEETIKRSHMLMGQFISEEANAAVGIKRDRPIMVVLGNPPYSGHSANASTRKEAVKAGSRYRKRIGGKWDWATAKADLVATVPTFIGELLDDYYQVDGESLGERNPKWLQDDYVKFLRFGQWRIGQTGQGVLAFITNHGYLDNPTFRGMRQQLMNAFTDIYILYLHGNSKKKERAPNGGPDENVFDIQQGVAIGIFVKALGKEGPATVHHADLWGTRESKYAWLMEHDLPATAWSELVPRSLFYLLTPQNTDLLAEYQDGWKLPDVFPVNSVGIVTARDDLTIHWTAQEVMDKVKDFARLPEEEARSKYRLGKDARDWKVSLAQADIRAHGPKEDLVAPILYRPFDRRYTYYTGRTRGFICMPRPEVMRHMLAGENVAIVTVRQVAEGVFNHAFVANSIVESRITLSNKGIGFLFPLYLFPSEQEVASGLYPPDERRPNLAPAFIEEAVTRLGLMFVPHSLGDLTRTFGPEDVLHYMYGVLHSPNYRKRYAESLKMDFPRVPLTSDVELFRALAQKGAELLALHLLESPTVRQHVTRYPIRGDNVVETGHPRYLAPGEPEPGTGKPLRHGRVYISKDISKTGKTGQYIEGIPPEVWGFQVGGYQVCDKWLKARRGSALTNSDLEHYESVVVAIKETMRLMTEIDEVTAAHGGWPIK
jgi:hypothetical protein